MHPHRKDSTINYPAADSWQPLILLTSALLLLLQRLAFKKFISSFFQGTQKPGLLFHKSMFYYLHVIIITTVKAMRPHQKQNA